jgi:hypothetical protein
VSLPIPTLASAFRQALAVVERRLASDQVRIERYAALLASLRAEQSAALTRGAVDAEWVRHTVRDVATWVPDDDITLLAALGSIARAR